MIKTFDFSKNTVPEWHLAILVGWGYIFVPPSLNDVETAFLHYDF